MNSAECVKTAHRGVQRELCPLSPTSSCAYDAAREFRRSNTLQPANLTVFPVKAHSWTYVKRGSARSDDCRQGLRQLPVHLTQGARPDSSIRPRSERASDSYGCSPWPCERLPFALQPSHHDDAAPLIHVVGKHPFVDGQSAPLEPCFSIMVMGDSGPNELCTPHGNQRVGAVDPYPFQSVIIQLPLNTRNWHAIC